MKIIKFQNYQEMPWRNGKGITYQILISPLEASLAALDFDLRISMAKMTAENEFSQFPHFKRILTVIDGKGITINDSILLNREILKFDGNEKIVSRPLGEQPILDLGVIYNPNKFEVEVLYSSLQATQINEMAFVFFLSEITIQNIHFKKYDSLFFENEKIDLNQIPNKDFIFIGVKKLH